MAGLAGAAFADSLPPLSSGPAASLLTIWADVGYPRGRPCGPFEPAQSRSLRPAPARRVAVPRGRFGAAERATAPGPLGVPGLERPEPAWRHGGPRPALDKYGVQLTILENVETFGNLSGGVKQGFETNGLTTVTLQMDTEKAFGLKGGTLNVSGLQVLGRQTDRGQSLGPADPERHRGARSAFGFGSSGISRNSATNSTSRSASRASMRNSSSAQPRTPSSSMASPVFRGCRR